MKNSVFWVGHFGLNLKCLVHPHQYQSKNFWLARLCQNFDYYSGFQHKTTAAWTYATQCILTTSCPMSLKRTRYRFHIKIICKSLIPNLFVLQNSICIVFNIIKSDPKRMLLLNNCYKIVSGHFFAICIFIFHKTEVQAVILRWLMGLNFNWFKSYDTKRKYFHFSFFLRFFTKTDVSVFCIFCIFVFFVFLCFLS